MPSFAAINNQKTLCAIQHFLYIEISGVASYHGIKKFFLGLVANHMAGRAVGAFFDLGYFLGIFFWPGRFLGAISHVGEAPRNLRVFFKITHTQKHAEQTHRELHTHTNTRRNTETHAEQIHTI